MKLYKIIVHLEDSIGDDIRKNISEDQMASEYERDIDEIENPITYKVNVNIGLVDKFGNHSAINDITLILNSKSKDIISKACENYIKELHSKYHKTNKRKGIPGYLNYKSFHINYINEIH